MKVRWLDDVERHDFDAAEAYLSLRLDDKRARMLAGRLRRSRLTERRANDILRACDRDPLPLADPGVKRAFEHVKARKQLSPILVVSFDFGADIADGYHRVSLAYALDPFMAVPLRITSL